MKNSHIQLAKGHMRPFSNKETSEFVYRLDIKSNSIDKVDIKILDTSMGFYSDVVETAMNDQYENQFFSIRKRLVEFFEKKRERLFLDDNDRKTIIRFINLAILRSEKSLRIVNETSITTKILGNLTNNDLVRARLSGILKENAFDEYAILIIKNNTEKNFVLPSNSYYFVTNLYKSFIVAEFLILIPLTPKIAILLLPFKNNHKFLSEQKDMYMIIDKVDDIAILNKYALQTELEYDKKFIISKTKNELEVLQEHG